MGRSGQARRRRRTSRFLEQVGSRRKRAAVAPLQLDGREETAALLATLDELAPLLGEQRIMVEDEELANLLSRCTIDLRARAERDELRPAFLRDEDLLAVQQLLTSMDHVNPIILGKARSGKTALVHELVRRLVKTPQDMPEKLRDLPMYEMTPASLLAGLQFGEGWRANLSTLFGKLAEHGAVLLFIRDIHAAVGAGVKRGDDDDDDLAAALESNLHNGKLKIIAEARPDRWQAIAADRESFADLFTSIQLAIPKPEQIAEIVQHVAERHRQRATIEAASQATAIDIAGRFILNQAFPGKAIELLEDSLLLAERQHEPEVLPRHVVECFGNRTGLTKLLLDENERFDEIALRRSFSERVLGQDPSVIAMVQKLALLKARLHDPARPMGVYFFLGPTGVGKTELAKTLASTLFGSEERFVRFNMADYSGEYDFAQLFGRTWGDSDAERRGKLTMALINLPFAVLLLDEFEKAHRSIFNRFLQLFDEGILVNAMGEEINLRNTIIIMTSNFGATIVQGETWGFAAREGIEAVERRVLRETEEFFSPEFINRLDGVIFFKPLSQSDMRKIAAREMRKLFEREGLVRRNVQVELDDAVLDILLKHGYSIRYGARYLKRQIEKMVTYPLASALLTRPEQTNGLLRLYVAREQIKASWVANDDDEPLLPSPEEQALQLPQTIEEAAQFIEQLHNRLNHLIKQLNVVEARERQTELMDEMSSPSFWDDHEQAQFLLTELSNVARRVGRCDDLRRLYDDADQLLQRIRDRNERRLFPELMRMAKRLERDLRFAELEMLFSNPEDWHDAYIILESDQAGLRWVRNLANAYLEWSLGKRFEAKVIDETPAEDNLIRVTLQISGSGAFGLLRSEAGTHRISETGGEPRLKTVTQVQITVLPVPTEDTPAPASSEIEMAVMNTRADGYFLRKLRVTGRALHRYTGAAAFACAGSERAVREMLLSILLGRLAMKQLDDFIQPSDDAWGSVVRSYHLGKRSTIKDPRTEIVHTNPKAALAGELDLFIEAALRWRAALPARR